MGLGLTYPDSIKLLSDPGIWIGDTANNTTQRMNYTNKVSKDNISVENGENAVAACTGTIKGKICQTKEKIESKPI